MHKTFKFVKFKDLTPIFKVCQHSQQRPQKSHVFNLREAVELYLENAKELNILDDVAESLRAKEKYTAHFEAAL